MLQQHIDTNDQNWLLCVQHGGQTHFTWSLHHCRRIPQQETESGKLLPESVQMSLYFHKNSICLYLVPQVVVLQKHARRWQARRFTDQLQCEKEHHQDWVKKEEVRRKLEKEEKIKAEYQRRMNPATTEDFELLYYSVESTFLSSKWAKMSLQKMRLCDLLPHLPLDRVEAAGGAAHRCHALRAGAQGCPLCTPGPGDPLPLFG